jgi:hypothetical protein
VSLKKIPALDPSHRICGSIAGYRCHPHAAIAAGPRGAAAARAGRRGPAPGRRVTPARGEAVTSPEGHQPGGSPAGSHTAAAARERVRTYTAHCVHLTRPDPPRHTARRRRLAAWTCARVRAQLSIFVTGRRVRVRVRVLPAHMVYGGGVAVYDDGRTT